MMRLAVHWADLHIADPEFAEACFTSPKTFAGEGSPTIDEFCVPEFATMLGRTNDSAGRFLTDCVEVAYRLPRLWGAVLVGSGRGVAGADHRPDHPRPDPGGRDPRRRAGLLVRVAADAVAAAVGWSTRPGCGSCPTPSRRPWTTRRTSGTSRSTPSRRRSTGPCTSRPTWRSPTPWRWPRPCRSGAEHLAKLGSTDTADGRRATALGDLARHQLTIGFDTDTDTDDGDATVATRRWLRCERSEPRNPRRPRGLRSP